MIWPKSAGFERPSGTLAISGDIGSGGRDYSPDPDGPSGVDHLIVESTYGDRERLDLDGEARRAVLTQELLDAHEAGGRC